MSPSAGAWIERIGRLRWLLPLAFAVAAALLVVSELGYRSSAASLQSLASRGAARGAIDTVLRRALDAETAQRGYLLTNRPEYLAPYEEADRDIAWAIAQLRSHHAHDAQALALVDQFDERVKDKLSELTATLRLFESGAHDRWRDLMFTNIGKERMDAVRNTAELLLAAEDRRVLAERAEIAATLDASRWGVIGLSALMLAALLLYMRQTAVLAKSRERHARELQAERDELEHQVRERTSELTALARHLHTAREDERSRLARELHDELGALLTAAKLDVARLKRSLAPMSAEVRARVDHLVSTLDQGVALKRRVIEDLRPSSLSNLGLAAALEIQAREFAQRAGLAVRTALEEVPLDDAAQINAYRVVQESFTNIAKHAAASDVELTLRAEDHRVRLVVHDNGHGFDIRQRRTGSHGLTGMRYRVEAAGGEFAVHSAPGQGTRIEAWLPLAATASPR